MTDGPAELLREAKENPRDVDALWEALKERNESIEWDPGEMFDDE